MIVSISDDKKIAKSGPLFPFVTEGRDASKEEENFAKAMYKMAQMLAWENYVYELENEYYKISLGFRNVCFNETNSFVIECLADEAKKCGISIGGETSKGVKKKITYEKYLGYSSKAENRNRK